MAQRDRAADRFPIRPVTRSGHRVGPVLALALLLTGPALLNSCRGAPQPDPPVAADPPAATGDSPSLQPGVWFDPASVEPGQRVGAMTVDSVTVVPTAIDSTLVGTVRFRGQLRLTGTSVAHFEADARETTSCFEAGASSSVAMPRWAGDERRPWFCFENPADARRLLGAAGEGMAFTIVIDRFTIHRGFSDQVNTARLVSAVLSSSTAERP